MKCYDFFIVEICWKCEFDTDVKIENYHHDEELLLFYEKVHIKTQSNKKDVLVIFELLLETTSSKKRGIPIYLIKSVHKRMSNAILNIKKADLGES